MIAEDLDFSDEEKVYIGSSNQENPAKQSKWTSFSLKQELQTSLIENNFISPTETQKKIFPILMEGKDLLCQAKSGSGKTILYIIGILNQLHIVNGNYKPLGCLIICHTRQLAHQIYLLFRKFARYFKVPELRVGCFFGGKDIVKERKDLKNPATLPHIVIGTPGRLQAHFQSGDLSLKEVQYFVVDECDELLKQGFYQQISKFFQGMKIQKQVLMFSATIGAETKKSAEQFMKNNEFIQVTTGKVSYQKIKQVMVEIPENQKLERLYYILDHQGFTQTVVFVNTKRKAKNLHQLLKQNLYNPICIHSDLPQVERITNYDNFKNNQSRLIIATDVFSRGITIAMMDLVINYDLPINIDTYLHRIGRIGIFKSSGTVINFVSPTEVEYFKKEIQQNIMEEIGHLDDCRKKH